MAATMAVFELPPSESFNNHVSTYMQSLVSPQPRIADDFHDAPNRGTGPSPPPPCQPFLLD